MAKDSPLPDCPLEFLPPPTAVQATKDNQTTVQEHTSTTIQDLTFCNQELSFPSFGDSISRPLVSVNEVCPVHTSTPSQKNLEIPSRKNKFDFIDRLKAVTTDDTDADTEDNHLNSSDLQRAVEKLTQELLVRSINDLAEKQSVLLEKMDRIIELRPICRSPPATVPYPSQSSAVAPEQPTSTLEQPTSTLEQPTSTPEQPTSTPEQQKDLYSEYDDQSGSTSQLNDVDSIYQLLEKKFSLQRGILPSNCYN